MGTAIQIENMAGLTEQQADLATSPITYENVAFFNPTSGFAGFLIPAVLILLIQQTLLLGIGILRGSAKSTIISRKQYLRLIRQGVIPNIIGKTMCYLPIYFILSVYLLWFIPFLFELPQIGSGLAISLFMLPYLLACIFFAMTLSFFVRDREAPFVLFVFSSVLLLFISGISWPASAIPWYWKGVSFLFPSTFGIQGFIKLNTMGASLREVSFEYWGLWLQALIYFAGACLVHRHSISLREKTT
jgi:ABC-2 type transport system permease protein